MPTWSRRNPTSASTNLTVSPRWVFRSGSGVYTTRASRSRCTPRTAKRWRSVCGVAPGMPPRSVRSDRALDGYLIVDFDGFDAWFEEDEPNVGHPKDPFHRIDILHSSREVRIELDGEVLADSTSVYFLFEAPLPVRYYFPATDVRTDLLTPSTTTTYCAYKGKASHWSRVGEADIAWTYEAPLRDAEEVRGRIAFYNERLDVIVDGKAVDRPLTPWSRR